MYKAKIVIITKENDEDILKSVIEAGIEKEMGKKYAEIAEIKLSEL